MTTRVGVVGAGYVGLTTAVCLADAEFDTVCIDLDADRVAQLRNGVAVIDEPRLEDLLRCRLRTGQLRFGADYAALHDRDVVFVCVPTPTADDGAADLSAVDAAVDELAGVLPPGAVVVVKSTVPVGTCRRLGRRLRRHGIEVVSNPEFLREGRAVDDFCHPGRVLVGTVDDPAGIRAGARVARLYGGADTVLRMSPESAELAKYACNAFLAVKLSFVNSLAELSGQVGADIGDIAGAMGTDDRIGPHFLAPGPGWGGSCLPKDTAALLHTGRQHGTALPEVTSARRTNGHQTERILTALRHRLNRPLRELKVTALGVTFKAGTSDVRDSPAITICTDLQRVGAQLTAYDPRLESIDTARLPAATASDPYVAVKDADAILVLTEWPEFGTLDWERIGRRAAPEALVLDTRNVVDADAVRRAGLAFVGNGTAHGY
ncbi:nucleotide sugar dehydrogenase [Mycobacterium sp. 1274756.6]|uniref:UDP-glucose dehydrogenase family protein n=1 Tax=Mycobacterium sp. 1274756.6 TaxID=1834076 RepID=UPI0008010D3C|nr:nucleotide sugar dehydrogenase [Mycobacterium sp. 1274756.6]OBJ72452.1 UDP-glucose 6-dehydrogenase [Mycobacterium sp. 1274756.6]